METPRPRSPPPPPLPPPLLFKPTTPRSPPPPLLSPSRDLSFAFSISSPPTPPVQLCALPLAAAAADMSRTPLGRVGSDLSHNNYAKASHHRQTASSNGSSSGSKERDREYKAKNKASSPFFSSLGSSWRSGESRDTAAAGKAEEEAKRKAKAKRGLDVGLILSRSYCLCKYVIKNR
ncbi:hypothetical protein GUJ93_ZPchr0002g24052 [Zizania palustris]|uniref:Uncharacterized protein n=1 Tax=Zizania palustris TaxID=103762 RepID=A0A8J5S7C4_ZIZPA|nr:hypothetical protein GUJ93_ZPchr0002g24052 [Zizania palustris]